MVCDHENITSCRNIVISEGGNIMFGQKNVTSDRFFIISRRGKRDDNGIIVMFGRKIIMPIPESCESGFRQYPHYINPEILFILIQTLFHGYTIPI